VLHDRIKGVIVRGMRVYSTVFADLPDDNHVTRTMLAA